MLMKKLALFILCSIMISTSCDDNFSIESNLSKEQQLAFSLFDTTGLCKPPIGVLISKEIVPPETLVLGMGSGDYRTEIFSPSTPTWLVFVDLKSSAYWAHECEYHFVDTSTGNVSSIDGRFPPQIPMDTVMLWGVYY